MNMHKQYPGNSTAAFSNEVLDFIRTDLKIQKEIVTSLSLFNTADKDKKLMDHVQPNCRKVHNTGEVKGVIDGVNAFIRQLDSTVVYMENIPELRKLSAMQHMKLQDDIDTLTILASICDKPMQGKHLTDITQKIHMRECIQHDLLLKGRVYFELMPLLARVVALMQKDQSQMEFPFTTVHALCSKMLDHARQYFLNAFTKMDDA